MVTDLMHRLGKGFLILLLLSVNGCSYFLNSATESFAENLKHAVLKQNDPQVVAEALPAYLLLQESLLIKDPENEALLMSTATLYASYITLTDHLAPKRNQSLSQKAFELALDAACVHKQDFCALNTKKFEQFTPVIEQASVNDIDTLYSLGSRWVNWIQANPTDWNAIAQLAQVKHIMKWVISIKDDYKNGEPYLYSAVLESLVPPALGGKPDLAKANFEKALVLSNNKNLMVHVLYAKYYARMMFDRELHDRLLNTVINTDAEQDNLTLNNTLAKQMAETLLQSADEYF